MSVLEMIKTAPSSGAGIEKMRANYLGLVELLTILDEIKHNMHGIDLNGIETPPPDKPPAALLDMIEGISRLIGRCHQSASDIRKIVL